ncbi:MAG: restriction endonuclease subunit S [Prevotellaceae bacterium]|nr:restriction endonuclease subunit S [Prevotellaceae bacterium]
MIETRFKDTEIGKIPEKWGVSSFGEQFKKLNAASYTWKETSKEGDCAYLHYGEIHTKYHDHLNLKSSDLPYISCSQARNFTKLQNGDLVMLNASEDYEGVNDCVEIENCDKDLVAGQHTIPLRPTKDKFEKGFIGYIPSIPIVRNQIVENAVGTKVYGVTNEMLKAIFIPIPTKVEQRRIATALSNVDALIAAVEKKIEKKKLIKQGAMQQLLTGKKRLNGYKGEWVEKKISELGQVVTGSTPPRNNRDLWNGDFCWVSAQDFKGKYIDKTVERISAEGKHYCRFLPSNSILVTCIASIGLNAISKVPCATNQQINSIICNLDKYEPEFIYYQICNKDKELKSLAAQTAVPIISKGQFENFTLNIPSDPSEQRAIASILSNMDSEITALERKRDKLKELKQGMMQQLLTGKIRLVRCSG